MSVQFHQIITYFFDYSSFFVVLYCLAVDSHNYWHRYWLPSFYWWSDSRLFCNFYNHFVGLADARMLVLNVSSTGNYLCIKFTKKTCWHAFIKRPSKIYVVFYSKGKIINFLPQPYSILWWPGLGGVKLSLATLFQSIQQQ